MLAEITILPSFPPSLARPPARPTRASKQQSEVFKLGTFTPPQVWRWKVGTPPSGYINPVYSASSLVLSFFAASLRICQTRGRPDARRTLSAFLLRRREKCGGFAAIPRARLRPRPSANSALACREIRMGKSSWSFCKVKTPELG